MAILPEVSKTSITDYLWRSDLPLFGGFFTVFYESVPEMAFNHPLGGQNVQKQPFCDLKWLFLVSK